MSMWIRPAELTASTLYLLAGKTDGSNISYALALYGDEVRMYIGSSSNYETTNAANLEVGKYYQINAIYSASGQTVTIYINGVLQASTPLERYRLLSQMEPTKWSWAKVLLRVPRSI